MIPTTRLPKETARSYDKFRFFLGLGPERDHARVAKHYRCSIALIRKLSTDHKWKERIKTADAENYQREMDADAAAKLAVANERERRKTIIEESSWEMFEEIRAKVKAMLKFPIQTARTTDEEGRKITIRPAKWTFADAARMANMADLLARMGLGMPVGRQEVTGKDGKDLIPVQAPVLQIIKLSDEESRELIKQAKPKPRKEE